jgi:glutamate-1-semialdehyde 2,1-aminomutase
MGAPSTRQSDTIEWADRLKIKSLSDLTKYTEPVFIDIRLNNKCNAMCRSCRPGSSDLIDKEYVKLKLVNHSVGVTENPEYDSINLDHIQRMYVAGGEPSINEYFIKFLNRCIEQGTTDFELLISTNAAAITEKFANLIAKFSNVRFLISVDGLDNLNNYIRYPIVWNKLVQNIDLLDNIANGRITFNSVISIYNGGMLFPLFDFLQSKYPHAQNSFSILSSPSFQRIDNFPNKEVALADLEKVKTLKFYKKYPTFRSEIDALINLISTSKIDYMALEKFFEFNDKLDKSRNMNLRDYNPILDNAR